MRWASASRGSVSGIGDLSCSQEQQCKDQDRQTKHKRSRPTTRCSQIHNKSKFHERCKITITSRLYSSQSALNLVKFIKTEVFFINLCKKDYDFAMHACKTAVSRTRSSFFLWRVNSAILCRVRYWYAIFVCTSVRLVTTGDFRSTPPSRPNKVGLKCPYVRLSTKSFFNFNEIWYVGRGRRVKHDGMQYDPIHVKIKVTTHEPLNVGNSAFFKRYLLPHL